MSSRIDFLKNISNNNIKEMMCNYFDQNMALYNLIYENINRVDVTCDIKDQNIYFNIKSNTDIEMEVLNLGIRNHDTVFCYGKYYNINLNASKNSIIISFNEMVVG